MKVEAASMALLEGDSNPLIFALPTNVPAGEPGVAVYWSYKFISIKLEVKFGIPKASFTST